jgi:biopolymer transport protein ExbD
MMTGRSPGMAARINMTPLVDVVLVLLIIFLVITPLLARGKDVRLPKARAADDARQAEPPLVVSITASGSVFLGETRYLADDLASAMVAALGPAPGKTILLKGDESLRVGDVRRVMQILKQTGATGIALAVREPERR